MTTSTAEPAANAWEAVIGLEVHVQLATRSRLFCACPIIEDERPNQAVCPVCLAHPGALPVPNREAVALATRAALALGCTLHNRSVFARKHYFYPDLAKGYQISQDDRPFATDGAVHAEVAGERMQWQIHRIHLEEDAGKSVHGADGTRVDFDRAGTPLIEIVSDPCLKSPDEAEAYLRMLHRVVTTAGVTSGDLEKGHFRCDANVSVRRPGAPLGTRVEIKNVNSFRFVARAIRFEIERQIRLIEGGGAVVMETRGYRDGETVSMREKEGSADYRYLPDPDLPVLDLEPLIPEARSALVAAPLDLYLLDEDARASSTFNERHGLDPRTGDALRGHPEALDLFSGAVAAGAPAKSAAGWVLTEALRLAAGGPFSAHATPERLAALIGLVTAGDLPHAHARKVFEAIWTGGGDPREVAAALGLGGEQDEGEMLAVVRQVLAENPAQVAAWRGGKLGLSGWFVGTVMRALSGRSLAADPARVRALVEGALGEGEG
jgi:aspartyl-tRNA(Asn)/glutamyl-tRNA(Gln) amidotransferase subunit B